MQANPFEEWQRLSELYREKSEEELLELADDFADLTETAQQILRDEMRKRGIGDPGAPDAAQNHADIPGTEPNPPATVDWEQQNHGYDPFFGQEDTDQPHEYTWKTPLCECEDREEAWQLAEVLRRAGIESWIAQPGTRYSFGAINPRLLVAADQLEQAREIAEQPIPQEIVEQSRKLICRSSSRPHVHNAAPKIRCWRVSIRPIRGLRGVRKTVDRVGR